MTHKIELLPAKHVLVWRLLLDTSRRLVPRIECRLCGLEVATTLDKEPRLQIRCPWFDLRPGRPSAPAKRFK